jgi:hypothetical protein
MAPAVDMRDEELTVAELAAMPAELAERPQQHVVDLVAAALAADSLVAQPAVVAAAMAAAAAVIGKQIRSRSLTPDLCGTQQSPFASASGLCVFGMTFQGIGRSVAVAGKDKRSVPHPCVRGGGFLAYGWGTQLSLVFYSPASLRGAPRTAKRFAMRSAASGWA